MSGMPLCGGAAKGARGAEDDGGADFEVGQLLQQVHQVHVLHLGRHQQKLLPQLRRRLQPFVRLQSEHIPWHRWQTVSGVVSVSGMRAIVRNRDSLSVCSVLQCKCTFPCCVECRRSHHYCALRVG